MKDHVRDCSRWWVSRDSATKFVEPRATPKQAASGKSPPWISTALLSAAVLPFLIAIAPSTAQAADGAYIQSSALQYRSSKRELKVTPATGPSATTETDDSGWTTQTADLQLAGFYQQFGLRLWPARGEFAAGFLIRENIEAGLKLNLRKDFHKIGAYGVFGIPVPMGARASRIEIVGGLGHYADDTANQDLSGIYFDLGGDFLVPLYERFEVGGGLEFSYISAEGENGNNKYKFTETLFALTVVKARFRF